MIIVIERYTLLLVFTTRANGMVVSDICALFENSCNVFSAALAGVELVRHSKEQELAGMNEQQRACR